MQNRFTFISDFSRSSDVYIILLFAGPGIDTPTMERLRPKPIVVNNITVTPQRLPDTQPSPGRAEAVRVEIESVEGEI